MAEIINKTGSISDNKYITLSYNLNAQRQENNDIYIWGTVTDSSPNKKYWMYGTINAQIKYNGTIVGSHALKTVRGHILNKGTVDNTLSHWTYTINGTTQGTVYSISALNSNVVSGNIYGEFLAGSSGWNYARITPAKFGTIIASPANTSFNYLYKGGCNHSSYAWTISQDDPIILSGIDGEDEVIIEVLSIPTTEQTTTLTLSCNFGYILPETCNITYLSNNKYWTNQSSTNTINYNTSYTILDNYINQTQCNYTITLDGQGGTSEGQSIITWQSNNMNLTNLTLDHYEDQDGNIYNIGESYIITRNIQLTPIPNLENCIAPQIGSPEQPFEKTHYTTNGWKDILGNDYTANSTTLEDLELFQQWKGESYTLKYTKSDNTTGTATLYYDEALPILSDLKLMNGYKSITSYKITDSSNDITLYNKINGVVEPALSICPLLSSPGTEYILSNIETYVTITFDYNYGLENFTNPTFQHVYSQESSYWTIVPYRPYYTFDGWYENNDGTGINRANLNSTSMKCPFSTNTTLYAKWSITPQSDILLSYPSAPTILNFIAARGEQLNEDTQIFFSGNAMCGCTGENYSQRILTPFEREFNIDTSTSPSGYGLKYYDNNGEEITVYDPDKEYYIKPLSQNSITIEPQHPFLIFTNINTEGEITGVNDANNTFYQDLNGHSSYSFQNNLKVSNIPNSANDFTTWMTQYLTSAPGGLSGNTSNVYNVSQSYIIRAYCIINIRYTQGSNTIVRTIGNTTYAQEKISLAFFTYDINATGREMAFGCTAQDQYHQLALTEAPQWKENTYYSYDSTTDKYILLTSQPGDWSERYNNYYIYDISLTTIRLRVNGALYDATTESCIIDGGTW